MSDFSLRSLPLFLSLSLVTVPLSSSSSRSSGSTPPARTPPSASCEPAAADSEPFLATAAGVLGPSVPGSAGEEELVCWRHQSPRRRLSRAGTLSFETSPMADNTWPTNRSRCPSSTTTSTRYRHARRSNCTACDCISQPPPDESKTPFSIPNTTLLPASTCAFPSSSAPAASMAESRPVSLSSSSPPRSPSLRSDAYSNRNPPDRVRVEGAEAARGASRASLPTVSRAAHEVCRASPRAIAGESDSSAIILADTSKNAACEPATGRVLLGIAQARWAAEFVAAATKCKRSAKSRFSLCSALHPCVQTRQQAMNPRRVRRGRTDCRALCVCIFSSICSTCGERGGPAAAPRAPGPWSVLGLRDGQPPALQPAAAEKGDGVGEGNVTRRYRSKGGTQGYKTGEERRAPRAHPQRWSVLLCAEGGSARGRKGGRQACREQKRDRDIRQEKGGLGGHIKSRGGKSSREKEKRGRHGRCTSPAFIRAGSHHQRTD